MTGNSLVEEDLVKSRGGAGPQCVPIRGAEAEVHNTAPSLDGNRHVLHHRHGLSPSPAVEDAMRGTVEG